MTLDEQELRRLSPFQVIQVTHRVVRRRCIAARQRLFHPINGRVTGALEGKFEDLKGLTALAELERYLHYCLHYPGVWERVGDALKSSYVEYPDPGEWAPHVFDLLKEVVMEVPKGSQVH